MKVAYTYNVRRTTPELGKGHQPDLEFDDPAVIDTIAKAIEKCGHTVLRIEADDEAFTKLQKHKDEIDIVFNTAEGIRGDARESQIPLFCEMLGIPYSHSNPTTHAITLNKQFTKQILAQAGINVPQSIVIRSKTDVVPETIAFPVIVKPNNEGSSKGILDKSVVEDKKDLAERIQEISENYSKEVLVEEFIDGREFTVAILGNKNPRVLPIIEQKFDFLPQGMYHIASFELKWVYEDALKNLEEAYTCPANLTEEEKRMIEDTTVAVFGALNCVDCSRVDYRMNRDGKLYFIEINSLPGLNPDPKIISYFRLAASAAGMSFDELIAQILSEAISRYPHLS